MDRQLQMMFLRQAHHQCDYVLIAWQSLTAKDRRVIEFFYSLESLYMAAANISKVFWGERGKHGAARKPLRDAVGLTKKSALRPTAMRNHFEHFDSRIMDWWSNATKSNPPALGYTDMNVGLMVGKGDGTGRNYHLLRNWVPGRGEMYFFGKAYDVAGLVNEVRVLKERLEANLWNDDPYVRVVVARREREAAASGRHPDVNFVV